MPQTFGVENLKKLIQFSCDFTKNIAEALADGKFVWTEAFKFFNTVTQIPGVIKSFPDIKYELSELSEEEREELYAYFALEFDIADDRVEILIEHSLNTAIGIVALVEEWKKKPQP